MGQSLQDQLRSLGLAGKEPREGGKKRGKAKAKTGPARGSAGTGEMSLDRAWALRERDEKRAAEQARQARLAAERRRREINARLKELVDSHRRNVPDADVARHFLYRGRIRKLYVTAEQQQALAEGRLGIVYLSGGYHLLETGQIEQAKAIDADHVVDLAAGGDAAEDDHPVPDDLTW